MKVLLVIAMVFGISSTYFLSAQEIAFKYSLDAGGEIRSATFSPDGKLLATTFGTKTDIWLWDTETGNLVSKLSTGKDPVNLVRESDYGVTKRQPGFIKLRFSPEYGLLAVAAEVTKDVRIWDVKSGRLLTIFTGIKGSLSFEFSPDGNMLALAIKEQGLKIIDVFTGQLFPGKWDFTNVESVNGAVFSQHGDILFVAIALKDKGAGGFHFVELASGRIVASILSPRDHYLSGRISRDRNRMLTIENVSSDLKVWDMNTGQLLNTINAGKTKIADVTISYDGKKVAALTKSGTLQLWNSETSQILGTLEKQDPTSTSIYFCAKNNRMVIENDAGFRIWNPQSGELGQVVKDGRLVALGSDGKLIVTRKREGGAQFGKFQIEGEWR